MILLLLFGYYSCLSMHPLHWGRKIEVENGTHFRFGYNHFLLEEDGSVTLTGDNILHNKKILVNISPRGNIMWAKEIGKYIRKFQIFSMRSSPILSSSSVTQKGKHIIVSGAINDFRKSPREVGIYLASISTTGEIEWTKYFQEISISSSSKKIGDVFLYGEQFLERFGNEYICVSHLYSYDDRGYRTLVTKFSDEGEIIWNKMIRNIIIRAIITKKPTNEGNEGYILFGDGNNFGERKEHKLIAIHLGSEGSVSTFISCQPDLSTKEVFDELEFDSLRFIGVLNDQSYLIVWKGNLMKISQDLNIDWIKQILYSSYTKCEHSKLLKYFKTNSDHLEKEKFLIVGEFSEKDFFLMEINEEGEIIWVKSMKNENRKFINGFKRTMIRENNIFMSFYGKEDVFLYDVNIEYLESFGFIANENIRIVEKKIGLQKVFGSIVDISDSELLEMENVDLNDWFSETKNIDYFKFQDLVFSQARMDNGYGSIVLLSIIFVVFFCFFVICGVMGVVWLIRKRRGKKIT